MRKEIVIGTDVKPTSCCKKCMWYKGDVSKDNEFYILSLDRFDFRIYIYKDSKEGEDIKNWLSQEENRNNDSVERKVIELILPYLTVDDFFEIISKEITESFNNGYKKAKRDIRKALGV